MTKLETLKITIEAVRLRRQIKSNRLDKLSQQAAEEYRTYTKEVEEVAILAGFRLCQYCQGFGGVPLDPFAAARRTLGMPNFDGCPKCGGISGDNAKEGLGFIPAD